MTWLLTQPVAAFWAYPVPAPSEENEKINSSQHQVPFQLDLGKAALLQPNWKSTTAFSPWGVGDRGGGFWPSGSASRDDGLERQVLGFVAHFSAAGWQRGPKGLIVWQLAQLSLCRAHRLSNGALIFTPL